MRSLSLLVTSLLLVAPALSVPTPDPDASLVASLQDQLAKLEKRQQTADAKTNLANEIAALNAANTANERYKILGNDGLSFDFLSAPSFGGGGKDGGVVLADNQNYPGVIGQGMSMLMGFLGPCGMVSPHIHPRASEYLLNIAGPPLLSIIVPENGATPITTELNPGTVGILPMGSVHMVAGTGCEPTLIMAAFNSESPGVLLFSTAYQALDTETVDAAFGGVGATVYNSSMIPDNVMLGRDTCLKKCGIDRKTFDIKDTSKTTLMMQAMAGWLKTMNSKN